MNRILVSLLLGVLAFPATSHAASVSNFNIIGPLANNGDVGVANEGTTFLRYSVTVTRASANELVLMSIDLETVQQIGGSPIYRRIGTPGTTLEVSNDSFSASSPTTATLAFEEEVFKSTVSTDLGTLDIVAHVFDNVSGTDFRLPLTYRTTLVDPQPLSSNRISNGSNYWLIGTVPGPNSTTFRYAWEKKLLIWVPVILNSTEGKDLRPDAKRRRYRRRVISRYSVIPSSVSNSLKPKP